jgi:hypothetical protein
MKRALLLLLYMKVEEAIYLACGIVGIFLDASALRRNTQHIYET